MASMKIGIMTGGGDAPGLNGIIEAAGRTLIEKGHEVYGVLKGFEGIFHSQAFRLDRAKLTGLHVTAGTVLGTSNRSRLDGRNQEFLDGFKKLGLNGLIVAGGDGTFRGLQHFRADIPIIGVPKTIDNDLPGTDFTFGFDTACSVVSEAVDSLKHTADAHERVFVVETMGRTAGWIALGGGLASYADVVLIPERPFSKSELKQFIVARRNAGQKSLLIVVAEGASAAGEDPVVAFRVKGSPQEERFGGAGERLARWIEDETGWEARHVVLGHLQRSRFPTTTDRFLTMGMGVLAAELAHQHRWQRAVVYRNGRIIDDDLSVVMGDARNVSANHPWIRQIQAVGNFV